MDQTEKRGLIKRLVARKEPAVKVFAVIGLVAVLLLLIAGAAFTAKYAYVGVQKISAAAVTLSSKVFSTDKEEVVPEVSAGEVESGRPFTLSWNHLKKATNGSYALYYPCFDGLFLSAKTLDSDKETILCNKYFDFVNRDNELSLTAYSDTTSTLELPIAISFTRNGESQPSVDGIITVTITNKNIKKGPAKEATKKETIVINTPPQTTGGTTGSNQGPTTWNTYTVGGTGSCVATNKTGKPDLVAEFIETGTLDQNKNFTKTDTPSRSAYAIAVKFRIANKGDKTSGTFNFNAYLPTYPSQIWNADTQPGLEPGACKEYTLGFDKSLAGNNPFTIRVDGGNLVAESDESNNDMTTTLRIQ